MAGEERNKVLETFFVRLAYASVWKRFPVKSRVTIAIFSVISNAKQSILIECDASRNYYLHLLCSSIRYSHSHYPQIYTYQDIIKISKRRAITRSKHSTSIDFIRVVIGIRNRCDSSNYLPLLVVGCVDTYNVAKLALDTMAVHRRYPSDKTLFMKRIDVKL